MSARGAMVIKKGYNVVLVKCLKSTWFLDYVLKTSLKFMPDQFSDTRNDCALEISKH